MVINILLALSLQCFTDHVKFLSSVEITKDMKVSVHRAVPDRKMNRLINTWIKVSDDQDVRILSLAWMESRLRPWVRRGDRGKACGMHQIHARYSYPLFSRKRGFNGWDEKTLRSRNQIRRECARLEVSKYSMSTMEKLLDIFDRKDKHPCHHNSGVYGECNEWYKTRLEVVTIYLYYAKYVCGGKAPWL